MITNFKNHPDESLYEGYKRFRGFVTNFLHRGFPPWLYMHDFVLVIGNN
jgi:hypothetical protein